MMTLDLNKYKDREKWSKTGIGASEIAGIIGVGYETPLQIWNKKQKQKQENGVIPPDDGKAEDENSFIRHGVNTEPQARERLKNLYGGGGEVVGVCDQPDWLKCCFDYVTPGGLPVEIKVPDENIYQQILDQGRQHPYFDVYYPQIQTQMYILGQNQGMLYVYNPDRGGIKVWYNYDPIYIRQVLYYVDKWYKNFILQGKPPPVDYRDVVDMSHDEDWLELADEVIDKRSEIAALRQRYEELKDEIKELENRMAKTIKPYMRARGGGVSLTHYKQNKVDYKRLAYLYSPVGAFEQHTTTKMELRSQLIKE